MSVSNTDDTTDNNNDTNMYNDIHIKTTSGIRASIGNNISKYILTQIKNNQPVIHNNEGKICSPLHCRDGVSDGK